MFKLNTADIAKELASNSKQSGDASFYKFLPDTGIYFFLLPPHGEPGDEEGELFRTIKKCNVDEVGGAYHTLWSSYGVDEADPVLAAYDAAGVDCPKIKIASNASLLIVSEGAIGSEQIVAPKAVIYSFNVIARRKIFEKLLEFPQVLDQATAASWYMTRTGSGQFDTRYSDPLLQSGGAARKGFAPESIDLVKEYPDAAAQIEKLWSSPPPLHKMWRLTDKARARDDELAAKLTKVLTA